MALAALALEAVALEGKGVAGGSIGNGCALAFAFALALGSDFALALVLALALASASAYASPLDPTRSGGGDRSILCRLSLVGVAFAAARLPMVLFTTAGPCIWFWARKELQDKVYGKIIAIMND